MSSSARHLTKRLPAGGRFYGADGEREFYCRECGARITVGLEGTEYGHFGDCEHRSPDLPGAVGSKERAYWGPQ